MILMLTLLPGRILLAQDDGFTFDRENFPPVIVAESCSDTLVTIESLRLPFAGYSMLDPYQRVISEATGTGFIVHPDGYILTSPSVVSDTKDLVVKYNDIEYEATVEVIDEYYDMALIKIDATGLPSVSWGDSNFVERGMPIVVMGAPAGLERTLTYGFVTNIRNFRVPGPRGADGMYVQDGFVIDAAIHSGVSSGPVFDRNGEMIGVVAMKAGGGVQNIGYVMPSNLVKHIVDQMITVGRVCHPWLGIFPYQYYTKDLALYMGIPVNEIDPESGEIYDVVGVLVNMVAEMSPAIGAGIVRGDLILRADNILMRTIGDLEETVQNKGCGEELELVIVRNYELRYIRLEIGDKQEDYGNIYVVGREVSI